MTARAGLVAVVRGLAVLAASHAMLHIAGTLLASGEFERRGDRGLLPIMLAEPVTHLLVASAAFAAAPWLAARALPSDAPLSPRALRTWAGLCAVLVAVDLGLRIGAGWVAWTLLDPYERRRGRSRLLGPSRVVLLVLCAGVATAAWVGPGRCGAASRGVARWFDRWFRASRPRPDVTP